MSHTMKLEDGTPVSMFRGEVPGTNEIVTAITRDRGPVKFQVVNTEWILFNGESVATVYVREADMQ